MQLKFKLISIGLMLLMMYTSFAGIQTTSAASYEVNINVYRMFLADDGAGANNPGELKMWEPDGDIKNLGGGYYGYVERKSTAGYYSVSGVYHAVSYQASGNTYSFELKEEDCIFIFGCSYVTLWKGYVTVNGAGRYTAASPEVGITKTSGNIKITTQSAVTVNNYYDPGCYPTLCGPYSFTTSLYFDIDIIQSGTGGGGGGGGTDVPV